MIATISTREGLLVMPTLVMVNTNGLTEMSTKVNGRMVNVTDLGSSA